MAERAHEDMLIVFAFLLAVHGLIHLMGAAKAFQWAELPQLTPSRPGEDRDRRRQKEQRRKQPERPEQWSNGLCEGRWQEADGEYAYIQLAIDDVQYNVAPR